jgi:hypothetical protein
VTLYASSVRQAVSPLVERAGRSTGEAEQPRVIQHLRHLLGVLDAQRLE